MGTHQLNGSMSRKNSSSTVRPGRVDSAMATSFSKFAIEGILPLALGELLVTRVVSTYYAPMNRTILSLLVVVLALGTLVSCDSSVPTPEVSPPEPEFLTDDDRQLVTEFAIQFARDVSTSKGVKVGRAFDFETFADRLLGSLDIGERQRDLFVKGMKSGSRRRPGWLMHDYLGQLCLR